MPDARTDKELLDDFVRSRDAAAFSELVGRYVNLVYSTAVRRTRDPHRAEDVTQTVFFLLSQRAARLSPKVILAGWLYQTARYVASDAMKAESRRQRHEAQASEERERERERSSVASAWEELSPELERALDRLAPADRDALLLRYFQGMDVAQTAEVLSLPTATAAKRLQRALERLRAHLADRGIRAPADVLGVAIAGNAVRAAPEGLARAVAAKPVAAIASNGVATVGAFGKLAIAAVAAVGVGAAAVVVATKPAAPVASTQVVAAPGAPARAAGAPQAALTPDQLQVVRAHLARLRTYEIVVTGDEWMASIKGLVDAGPAAVPEIVAELDRTSNDRTLRALGFTLRAIKDPRACPALIRALTRTSVLSSDFGLRVNDPAIDAFMRRHQIGPNDPRFIQYSRAVREIAAALEEITGHKIGRPWAIDASNDTPAQTKAARARHDNLSRQWGAWWEAHQYEFVTDADMASLSVEDHDPAEIEKAGVALFADQFPNQDRHTLAPAKELVLSLWDDNLDTPCLIDFDRGEVFSPLQSTRWFKPGVKDDPDGTSGWYSSDGAGADAYATETIVRAPSTQKSTGNNLRDVAAAMARPVTAADRRVATLYAIDTQVWQVEDALWGQLDSVSGIRLDPKFFVTRKQRSGFDWRDPASGEIDPAHLPATYVFRTREGGVGVVQVVGGVAASTGPSGSKRLRIRVRAFQPHPGLFTPRPPATLPAGVSYGDVRTVTLSVDAAGQLSAVDLDTGKRHPSPDEQLKPAPDATAWIRSVRADAVSMTYADGKVAGLRLKDVTFGHLSDAAFDAVPAGEALVALDHLPVSGEAMLYDAHRTALFRTHEGAAGLIQITHITPDSVALRYKLVRP